jgi:putative transposase
MQRRKRRVAINEPGHAHELTFSCFRRLRLLAGSRAKRVFLQCLDDARQRFAFEVWAYVVMPEHVHILIHPKEQKYNIGQILMAVKSRFAKLMLEEMKRGDASTQENLKVVKRDGTSSYRFWQAGGGYDRNLFSDKAIHTSIDYMHANPVRRKLCATEIDYEFSSARWYANLPAVFALDSVSVTKMEVVAR